MYRISFNHTYDRLLEQIVTHKFKIDRLSDDIASGKKIHRISDDPIAISDSMRIERSLSYIEEFKKNIDYANAWLSESETSLRAMNDSLVRAKELAVQMANATQSAETREGAAEEIDQIIRHLIAVGNAKYDDRYIFSGLSTDTEPFQANLNANGEIVSVTYQGDNGYFEIPTNFNSNTRVNVNGVDIGSQVGGTNDQIFSSLIALRDAMLANDPNAIRNQMTPLDNAFETVNTQMAKIGSRMNSLEAKKAALENIGIDKQILMSEAVDTDFAEAISNLEKTKMAFQASLALFNSISELNIVNYL